MHTRAATVAILLALPSVALGQRDDDRPRLSPPPQPEAFAERMLQRDADGDGRLSREEFTGQFAERVFVYDTDADGFLDRVELITAAEDLGQPGFGRRPGAGRPGLTPGAEPGGPGIGGGVALDFEGAMKQAGRALRQLRRSPLDESSRESDLRYIQALQANLIAAKGGVDQFPMAPQAEERYGDDLATYRSDFRLHLIQSIMESLALEAAIIEGDNAAAKESLEHLIEAQKAGHEGFQPDEDPDVEEGEGVEPEDAAPASSPAGGAPASAPGGG